MGGMRRLRRWLAHPPVTAVGALVLCGVLTYLAVRFRVAGFLAFVPMAGMALLVLTALIVVGHVGEALVARVSRETLQHAAQLGLLLVGNFLVLALLLGAAAVLVGALWPVTQLDRLLATLMAAALRGGAWTGAAGGVVAIAVAALISGGHLARRVPASVGRSLSRAVWALLIVYAAYVPLLTVSVALRVLGGSPPEVVAVVRAVKSLPGFAWLEVESWRRPGAVERIPLLRSADEAAVWRLERGRRVRLHTGSGPFGVPWVDHLRVDVVDTMPDLVAALPAAEWPRKWLMGDLTRRARWAELVAQAREYHRYHPADREAMARVVFSLRQHGQIQAARALEIEFGVASRQRGPAS